MDAEGKEGTAFTIFNYLSEPVIVSDARFEPPGPKVVYINDAFTAAYGLSKEDLLGRPLATVHPALRREDKLAAIEHCCRAGRTYTNDGAFPAPDGGEMSMSWHISPVFDGADPRHLVCFIKPVHDTPAFINALRTRERRYRNLFERGLVAKAIVDADGRFAEVNQSFCNLLGYTREELIGTHSSLVVREEDRDEVSENRRQVVAGERAGYQAERRYLHKQGHEVATLVDVMPEEDDDGEIRSIVIQAQDISALKATEAELRESESQLKAIFDNSPTEIYLKDAVGRYVKINRQFERMFNVRDEDLRGKFPHDAHYKDLADRTRAHDLQVLRTGEVVVREEDVFLENPPDELPHILHTIKFPILDEGEVVGLGAIATDITDTKRAEQALRESESRLRDFAEIAADWFWETDENFVITYISDVHRHITGIPDEQIIGRTREELFRENIYNAGNPAIHLRTLNHYWESMIEYSVLREDGHRVIIHDRATPFFDADGNFRGYRGVGRDITEQKRLNERIAYQAARDPLTGVVNRREFERRLNEAIAETRQQHVRHVLCFTDLNRFKLLNDTLGHAAGDFTLKTIVERIQDELSPGDELGRIGGDEFGILIRNTTVAKARQLATRITRRVAAHGLEWQGRQFSIALSVGLVPIDDNARGTSELMARADSACYHAKEHGRHGVWVSDENEAARLRTYSEVLRSLDNGSSDLSSNMQLVGQPIRALASCDHAPWYEVLLRLVGDDGRYYRPFEFIRLAEQHGAMPSIDRWVFERAVSEHARLVEEVPDAVLSVNVAANSLSYKQLRELTDRALDETPLEPRNLCFEIGEATAMVDLERAGELVRSLSERGFRVALDEFGGGPSSFECLKHLPVHCLKLYGDLARELGESGPDVAIVESVRDLCRRLALTMVAVQVETRDAARVLARIGVEYGQGDALATTRPLAELIRELAQTR